MPPSHHSECDPLNRPTLQAEALALLKSSSELDPTASETFYELAFVQAETRDVTSAIFSVRKALELEPADVQSWHLLTLLLSAQKDYKGALRIAEVGLAEAEADDEADEAATAINGSGAANNGNGSAAAPRLSGIVNGSAAGAAEVGSGAAPVTFSARTLLLSVDFAPRPEERTEAIFRLMMTHNALEEIVEGVDFAIQGQRELFEFFHKRIASGLGVEGELLLAFALSMKKMFTAGQGASRRVASKSWG